MESLNIENFGNRLYNITLRGNFDIIQTVYFNRKDLKILREIRDNLDDKKYSRMSEDEVIFYENGKLTLNFYGTSGGDRLNNNEIHIVNVKEFIDKILDSV